MTESDKKSTTVKKVAVKETAPEAKKVTEVKRVEKPAKTTSTQSVIIAVLATALVCCALIFGILLATGVIKFGDNSSLPGKNGMSQVRDDKDDSDDKRTGGYDDDDVIIENPNQKVKVNGNLVSVKDLEFYLPKKFEAGGKNDEGTYTYNLMNDDGWAQVLVYAEKSNLSPEEFLMKISPYLDITDDDYEFNNTEWVVGGNANALAYATELDGMIYAVYYSVKLDSDATGEAMQMIPKTLYMNKVYADVD